jgi:hypothetical protein
MAAMFAELLPWLIMRYLGEISSTEDRAMRGRRGPGLGCASQESRIESVLDCVFPGRRP